MKDLNILTMTFPKNKFLHLTLKKKWFDLIKSGEKKFEYRDVKPHWISRLKNKDGSYKDFDYILFRNGYSRNSPKMWVEFKGISLSESLFKGNPFFIIKLGKVLDYDIDFRDHGNKEGEVQ